MVVVVVVEEDDGRRTSEEGRHGGRVSGCASVDGQESAVGLTCRRYHSTDQASQTAVIPLVDGALGRPGLAVPRSWVVRLGKAASPGSSEP